MDLVPLLRSLIAIDSTSSRSNLPVLDRLDDAARALGFETRRATWVDEDGVEKGNLVCRRGPDTPGGLAFVGHTDCVPFDPDVERGARRRGAGRQDLRARRGRHEGLPRRRAGGRLPREPGKHPLALLFTADEEVGCLGAKRLLAEGRVHPRHAIVGEPTSLTPIRAHKGYCAVEVVIEGVEGHSAYPDVGASAIHALGRLWTGDRGDRRGAAAGGGRRVHPAAHHLERRRRPRREGPQHHRGRVPLHLRVAAAARAGPAARAAAPRAGVREARGRERRQALGRDRAAPHRRGGGDAGGGGDRPVPRGGEREPLDHRPVRHRAARGDRHGRGGLRLRPGRHQGRAPDGRARGASPSWRRRRSSSPARSSGSAGRGGGSGERGWERGGRHSESCTW